MHVSQMPEEGSDVGGSGAAKADDKANETAHPYMGNALIIND